MRAQCRLSMGLARSHPFLGTAAPLQVSTHGGAHSLGAQSSQSSCSLHNCPLPRQHPPLPSRQSSSLGQRGTELDGSDCVDHNKLWKILKEMGIPNHLTCLLRNLYAGQEATVKIFNCHLKSKATLIVIDYIQTTWTKLLILKFSFQFIFSIILQFIFPRNFRK